MCCLRIVQRTVTDSGVETTGPPSFLTPSSTNVEETADDGGGDAVEMALRRLEAAGVADDWDDRKLYDLISKGTVRHTIVPCTAL